MIDLNGCSDGELAGLALGGRQTAYAELMRRHRAAIFRLARSHAGDDDAAIKREFAPYVGVNWTWKASKTADYARIDGRDTTDRAIVAGVRFWF